METGERSQTKFLRVSRFQSIKTKILIFALLATIVPSLILGGFSYLQNSKLLREKISHELRNAAVQTSKELDLWLKERLYDLRVFSSSYIITENLARILGKQRSNIETLVALDHIKGYLNSVSEKFGLYEELTLINAAGKPVVTSSEALSAVKIPERWLEQLPINRTMVGKAHFNPQVEKHSMLIAQEVTTSEGRLLGVLMARINLNAISPILKLRSVGGIDELYLIDANRRLLVSSKQLPNPLSSSKPSMDIFSTVSDQPVGPSDYMGYRNKAVVGVAVPISAMGWVMIAEMEKDTAYAEIDWVRQITIVVVGGLMLCIGLFAYVFGHSLVLPVQRLSKEAANVATGNLEVDIPVAGLSEVSYLTQVFNHMVASLRHGREEISAANQTLLETNKVLHQLSITDGLTGLYNRKHIMDLLQREIVRSQRYNQSLAILILDIDFFKKINDTYGHQAGDAVMCQVAETLRSAVRECDYVGRYGGEEFLVILPNSDIQRGTESAERIRQKVCGLRIIKDSHKISVNISIGVSGYPEDGEDDEAIIRMADDALYHAKANGRNCVMNHAGESTQKPAAPDIPASPKLKLVDCSGSRCAN